MSPALLRAGILAGLACLPTALWAQTPALDGITGRETHSETDQASDVAIRPVGTPTWTRARNETNIILGGDVRLRASYIVVGDDGQPRGDVELFLYARGEGPLATARAFTDAHGLATAEALFTIDPGIAVTVQACLRGDQAVCSPYQSIDLRRRFIVSAETTTAYTFTPNLPHAGAKDVALCAGIRSCDAVLELYSATAGNRLDSSVVARARLRLHETMREGRRRSWSAFASLPVSYQHLWVNSYFGSRSIDAALALGDFAVGTTLAAGWGYVEAAFNGRVPTSTTAIDSFHGSGSPRFVNDKADGFASIDVTAQLQRQVRSATTMYVATALSQALPRRFEADVVARRGTYGRAVLGMAFVPGGSTFSLSPWVGVMGQGATRLDARGRPVTVLPTSTDVQAGIQLADIRGGPLATAVGATVSGFVRGQPGVHVYLAVNVRELFAIR